MPKVQPRDVSPILQKLRDFLLGRKHTTAHRFEAFVATRSPPPPELPVGPCHGLNKNYYFARDVRREVKPPKFIAGPGRVLGSGKDPCAPPPKKLPTPGNVYYWD